MNLYQISDDPTKLHLTKTMLSHGRILLLKWLKGEHNIQVHESLYLGSLVLELSKLLGCDPNLEIKEETARLNALKFHSQAVTANKGRVSKNDADGFKIDIKYSCSLIKGWCDNRQIDPNQSLYIGFLLLQFAKQLGIEPSKQLMNAKTMYDVTLQYYCEAMSKTPNAEVLSALTNIYHTQTRSPS